MTDEQISEKVWKSLEKVIKDVSGLDDSTNLFDIAALDSIDTLEFLEDLESVFNITIEDEIIFDERFSTIKGIVSIIKSKI